MALKIPSAIVDRHMFPRQTKSTDTGAVSEVMVIVSHVLSLYVRLGVENEIRISLIFRGALVSFSYP